MSDLSIEYYNLFKKAKSSLDFLNLYWCTRNKSITIKKLEKIELLLFSIKESIAKASTFSIQLNDLKKMDVMKEVSLPKNAEGPILKSLKIVRADLSNQINQIVLLLEK